MKRISVLIISVIIVCFSVISASAVDYKCDVETVSNAVYLENLNSGTVVYEKASDQRSYPASTTKIMTFIVTAENVGDLDQTSVTIKQDVIDGLDPESTVMGLSTHVGEQVSVRDLLYGLMLPSGNDAALVLADYVGGGISGFAEKMNAKAAELGCTDTHFANPHGLYDQNHYTTARDMALIAKHAMTIPGFMEICNTVYYTPNGFNTLHNTNYMLDHGDKYLCVCLGAAFSYDENVNYAMKDTAKLYGWAYENLGIQTIYSPADSLASVDVKYVRNGRVLNVVPEKDITAFLPNNYDNNQLKVEVNCPEQVEAPVTKGDVIGTVSVKYEDLDLGVTNIVASENIERDISPLEVFVTEHLTLILIVAAALVLIIVLIIILASAGKRRKARRRSRARKGQRYRD